ncbi:hypothetical protein GCM10009415_54050 [Chitinophaga japonensis]
MYCLQQPGLLVPVNAPARQEVVGQQPRFNDETFFHNLYQPAHIFHTAGRLRMRTNLHGYTGIPTGSRGTPQDCITLDW